MIGSDGYPDLDVWIGLEIGDTSDSSTWHWTDGSDAEGFYLNWVWLYISVAFI